jgi:hypothetical protein
MGVLIMAISDDTETIAIPEMTQHEQIMTQLHGHGHCGEHGELVTMIKQLCDEVKKLAREVRTINLALVGNYEQRGWLTRVDAIEKNLVVLEARVTHNEEIAKNAAKSVLRWALTAIGSGIVAAVALGWKLFVKIYAGQN